MGCAIFPARAEPLETPLEMLTPIQQKPTLYNTVPCLTNQFG